ncbi:copper chaperone CopZ [Wenyingzhuangia heitensis]|uniref:Copper chaperone CopZ n=1 Tax=Wenyingzhuangia heitensis TaxID=1487859 RepID=A0ABX0UER4_9FLAO|nr:cation transporter [Wenyingzhuangia heitensis]NIJ46370.1 copper chaperone CopZ [Wenyingzhuangia heitensis]
MKKIFLSVALLAVVGLVSCKNEAKKDNAQTETTNTLATTDISFGVRGNCAMCKMTIEKAANSVEGVTSANWDVKKKKIAISFDASKTNVMAVHNAIADSGYDTDKKKRNQENYTNLPGCCQYSSKMEMNQ